MTTKAFAPGFARNATTDRWSRYAPLTGVVAVVTWIIGLPIWTLATSVVLTRKELQ